MAERPGPDDLIGAWELDSWRISYSDDRPDTFPFGTDPQGRLIYEASGRMAVMLGSATRPPISDPNVRRAPLEEKAAAFDSFFGYCGRWRLEGDRVVHAVEMALNPNFAGTDQVRMVEYAGGRLTLSEESATRSGATMRNELAWRKVS